MRIEWKIIKKRGNLRPILQYTVYLEDHERSVALPFISILSTIPKPEEDRQDFCYPGQYERTDGYTPKNFHFLEAPSHKGYSWTHTLRLPWRSTNEYPEVESSLESLRENIEKELYHAYKSQPLELRGVISTSKEGKTALAPGLLAERFLRIAAKSA